MRRYLLAGVAAGAMLAGCVPAWAQRISDLPAASAGNASDLIACVQGYTVPGTGASRKCTAAQLAIGGLGYTPLAPANNLSDLLSAVASRTNLGLGSIATQSAGSVAITGGAIDGTALGGTTPAAGAFSALASITSLIVPNLASTPITAGSIAYNTGTGRFDFGIGASVVNHVRLTGDSMLGALHMGANLLDGSNISFTGGTLAGLTSVGITAGAASLNVGGTATAGKFQSNTLNCGQNGNVAFAGTVAAQCIFNLGTFTGTATGTQPFITEVSIGSDNINSSASNPIAYFGVIAGFGGTAYHGSRTGGLNQLTQNGDLQGSNSFIIGREDWIFGGNNHVVNGTHFVPYNPQTVITAPLSGTVYEALALGEANISIGAGTTISHKAGLDIINLATDRVQGSVYDTMLGMSSQNDTNVATVVGWKNGITWGKDDGQFPMDPAGTMLSLTLQTSNGTTQPFKRIVAAGFADMSKASFTGNAIAMPNNWKVTGAGAQSIGTALLSPDTNGLAIDSSGNLCTATIAANGGAYEVGEDVYGTVGDSYTVASVNGSKGILTMTQVNTGYTTGSCPGGTPSLTGGHGSGATVSYASTARTQLTLNGSGGVIKTGSGTWTANGLVATALSSVGPTGSHTTVQEWFTITDSAGTVRYIPGF